MRRPAALLALAILLTGCAAKGPDHVQEIPRPAPLVLTPPPERHHVEQNLSFSTGVEACASACVDPVPPSAPSADIRFASGLLRYALVVEWTPVDAATQQLRLVVQDACDGNATILVGGPPLRVDAPGARPLCGEVRLALQQPGVEAGPAALRNQEALPVHLAVDWEIGRLPP